MVSITDVSPCNCGGVKNIGKRTEIASSNFIMLLRADSSLRSEVRSTLVGSRRSQQISLIQTITQPIIQQGICVYEELMPITEHTNVIRAGRSSEIQNPNVHRCSPEADCPAFVRIAKPGGGSELPSEKPVSRTGEDSSTSISLSTSQRIRLGSHCSLPSGTQIPVSRSDLDSADWSTDDIRNIQNVGIDSLGLHPKCQRGGYRVRIANCILIIRNLLAVPTLFHLHPVILRGLDPGKSRLLKTIRNYKLTLKFQDALSRTENLKAKSS